MQDYEKLGVFYLGREFDPARGAPNDNFLLYDSRDLTTHAVCVGMTGSGKTGLCLALLEEAAIDGVPAICIDPKGDLANLLLTFPNLAPADFAPWVDGAEAARKGISVEELAAQTAAAWRKGLEQWGQPVERIARLRSAVDLAIYTPAANTGLPLSVLRSFAAPSEAVLGDATALRDRVATVVSGLLALLGRDADPLKSREHILLSNVIERAWRAGQGLDIVALIGAVQKPGFDKVGAFDLETFFPAKERLELAMALNNLLASPGFGAWTEGEPLDAQRLLFTADGDDSDVLWPEAKVSADLKSQLAMTPAKDATFAPLPAPAMRAASFAIWGKSLAACLYESARAEVLICDALKATSAPGEPEGEFRARLALAVRERRDRAVEELRRKYAPKLQAFDDRERRAQDRQAREQSQLTQQKFQAAISIGATILGAFMGRKTLSTTNVNRATTAVRAASRVGRESGDVDRADDNLDVIRQQHADLQRQFEADTAALERSLDISTISFRSVQVTPRKSDIAVGEVAVVWAPWRTGGDGFPAPAYD